mgnify:CR=1 FL=1
MVYAMARYRPWSSPYGEVLGVFGVVNRGEGGVVEPLSAFPPLAPTTTPPSIPLHPQVCSCRIWVSDRFPGGGIAEAQPHSMLFSFASFLIRMF